MPHLLQMVADAARVVSRRSRTRRGLSRDTTCKPCPFPSVGPHSEHRGARSPSSSPLYSFPFPQAAVAAELASIKTQQGFVCALRYKTYIFRCIDLTYMRNENAHVILVSCLLLSLSQLWRGARLCLCDFSLFGFPRTRTLRL